MKRIITLLMAALLLCLCATAWAEGGANIEIIKMDGVSVVVLTPETALRRARGIAEAENKAGLALPECLTLIGEEAFAGVAAERVEVSENVAAIEARAFADCKSLREIILPASVLKIDDTAFDGCENVTVYGEKGTEAERIASLYGFAFVDPAAQPEPPEEQRLPSATVLPPAPFD